MYKKNHKKKLFLNIKEKIFPIKSNEIKKFVLMSNIFLLILFIFTLLRNTKDTLVINAPCSGAEIIAFLKIYCVTPASIFYIIIYIKLSNILDQKKIFYLTVSFFLLFFGVYGFLIHPKVGSVHIEENILKSLQLQYPYFKWFFILIGNWSYTLFFILAELWGVVIINLLFWQFANSINSLEEAKRFYGLFGFIGNLGVVGAGLIIIACSTFFSSSILNHNNWILSFKYIMGFVVFAGGIILYLFYVLNKIVLPPQNLPNKSLNKLKLPLKSQLNFVIQSPHLRGLSLIVICYGISISFCDSVFKAQIHKAFPDKLDFNKFMGQISIFMGISTMVFMLIGSRMLRILNWRTAALFTPLILLIISAIFFLLIIYQDFLNSTYKFSIQIALMTAWIGLFQSVIIKATKYSLFDPTKEMVYIPLDENLRTKGKAAVDIVGNRLGKGAGGWIQSLLFIFTGMGFSQLTPFLGILILPIIIIWIFSIISLSKKINNP